MITTRRLLTLSLMLLWLGQSSGLPSNQESLAFDHSHKVYGVLLRTHVSEGLVNYHGLLSEYEVLLEYMEGLARVTSIEYKNFSTDEQLAFLINAYNALTLDVILQNYPVESITAIPGAWDERTWHLLGKTVTLNEIEHELIRNRFNEPRIHFALVCAAKGCPPLKNGAYTAEGLDGQLEEATREFVSDTTKNRLDLARGLLEVSKIFEWYGHDFVPEWGETEIPKDGLTSPEHRALVGFFQEYLSPHESLYLKTNPVRIHYLEYDWSLNDRDR